MSEIVVHAKPHEDDQHILAPQLQLFKEPLRLEIDNFNDISQYLACALNPNRTLVNTIHLFWTNTQVII